jgi:hypothetical protein
MTRTLVASCEFLQPRLVKKDPTQFRFTSDLYKSFTYLHWVFFHRSKQMWRWLLFLAIKCVISKCLFLGCQADFFITFCCQSCFDKPRNCCTSCSLPGILTATSLAQCELSQLNYHSSVIVSLPTSSSASTAIH